MSLVERFDGRTGTTEVLDGDGHVVIRKTDPRGQAGERRIEYRHAIIPDTYLVWTAEDCYAKLAVRQRELFWSYPAAYCPWAILDRNGSQSSPAMSTRT